MQNLSYENIQKFDMRITNKLLAYIENEITVEEILEEMDFAYPYFQDENNRMAFNIWLSMDFVTKEGKTYIEKFLEDKSISLSNREKEILIERSKSHVSLFEIMEYENEHIIVKDLLQNKFRKLWEPNLHQGINQGDFIFARIGKTLGHYGFIGDINYLPPTVKPMFIEEIFLDFNNIRRDDKSLTMKDYSKMFSLNLYRIYNDCIITALETSEDIASFLYDELDEFEGYLQNKANSSTISRHISNLIDLFEYCLSDDDLTLYDLDQLDLKDFFKEAIKDGFINSQESLNSYINTLKKYLGFLRIKTKGYTEPYEDLLHISKNRFWYMRMLEARNSSFKIDKELALVSTGELNEIVLTLLMNFDKFILYTMDRPLELTLKNKYIKRKYLLELDYILEKESTNLKQSPNQKDFPLIHMFYQISLYLKLLVINGNHLTLTKKGTHFLRLSDEEKYVLFFQYIWGEDFIKDIYSFDNISVIQNLKKEFANSLLLHDKSSNYAVTSIISNFDAKHDFFFIYYKYLELLGLIVCDLYPVYEIRITGLGKCIFKHLYEKQYNIRDNKIISLEDFKNGK